MRRGKLLEAFDQYYADNILMKDSNGTGEGKVAARAFEVQFVDMIKEVNGMEIKTILLTKIMEKYFTKAQWMSLFRIATE